MTKKITLNGEVDLDESTGIYTVWDEVYCDPVYKTKDLEVAMAVYDDYCSRLLAPDEGLL